MPTDPDTTTASEAAAVRELEEADRSTADVPDAEYHLGRAFAFGLLAIAEAVTEAGRETARAIDETRGA